MGKDRGMRPIGSLSCRFEDNIKMDHKEIGWEGRVLKTGTSNGFFRGCRFWDFGICFLRNLYGFISQFRFYLKECLWLEVA